ncbi:MAG: hypothetical protein R6W90_08500 [Ignavibacteriaceae bacterium]
MTNLEKQIILKLTIDNKTFVTSIDQVYVKINELESKFKNFSGGLEEISQLELIIKEEYERKKYEIEEHYSGKSQELDKQNFLYKISTTAQIVSTIANAYNQLYNQIQQNNTREVNEWEKKEKKKLDEEKKAALSHAKTSKQREKINEQFDAKEEALENEKQKKARERMATWFALQKAAGIASATVNTYQGAAAALAPPPLGAGPIFGPILAAATIAAGMMNVAAIAMQKMPGYARGGAVIGENGPEIIAPFQDYASGQSKLIAMTMMTLKDEMRSGRIYSGGYPSLESDTELRNAVIDLSRQLKEGITARAVYDEREARRIDRIASRSNRRSKI